MDSMVNFVREKGDNNQAYCLVIGEDAVFIKEDGDKVRIPTMGECRRLLLGKIDRFLCVGRTGGTDCLATGISTSTGWENIPEGFSFIKLRQLFGLLDAESYRLALRAAHIVKWRENNQFCGRCGGVMNDATQEVAMKCTACGYIVYPRISPAIIVAVTKGNEILLARSSRFPPGRYSVLAGFLEPGETLEECVRREVKEEVGIEVDAITYFGNQPWPFPDSQMIGFTARHAGGEITIDNNEIVAADWFTVGNFPDIPPKDSIARRLIDYFAAKN